MQQLINHDREKYQLPGLSVSINLNESSPILDVVSGNKITPDTLFQVGSITKTFIAALILILEQHHYLNTSDKLSKWLPQYPQWKNITIKQLLNHSSGTYEYGKTKNFWQDIVTSPHRVRTLKELADLAYQYPVNFAPGMEYRYSNTDYILLGLIIEKATSHSVQQNLQHYIIQKLNLKNTYYLTSHYPDAILKQVAHGHNNEGTFPDNTDVTDVTASYGASAGALLSTPHDIVKFIRALVSGKLLAKKQLNEMFAATFSDIKNQKNEFEDVASGEGIGLVNFKKYGLRWMHAGGNLGSESVFAWDPHTNVIVCLVYNSRPRQSFVFMQILQDIMQLICVITSCPSS